MEFLLSNLIKLNQLIDYLILNCKSKAGPKLIPGTKIDVFITILARRSIAHLQKMFAEYKNHVSGGIQYTIKNEISGHLQTALLAIGKAINKDTYLV